MIEDTYGMMTNSDPDYRKTNREKSKTASRTKIWCPSCDLALIGIGERCPICGKFNQKGKLKKY